MRFKRRVNCQLRAGSGFIDAVKPPVIAAPKHIAATVFDDGKVAPRIAVGEADRFGKGNAAALVWNCPDALGSAARTPVKRVFVIGRIKKDEYPRRTIIFTRPHAFVQSGRIGAAQRVSPDPPAEPHVQLSLHAALHCNNTILIPAIGQASLMNVGVTQIAQDFRAACPCGLHHRDEPTMRNVGKPFDVMNMTRPVRPPARRALLGVPAIDPVRP